MPCKVIPLKNGVYRRGRRGVSECKAGVMLYYLWHEDTGLYYIECFVNEKYAIDLAMRTTPPRNMNDVALYWRCNTKDCEHSYRTSDG